MESDELGPSHKEAVDASDVCIRHLEQHPNIKCPPANAIEEIKPRPCQHA